MQLSPELLRTFLAVAEAGSFTKAGEAVNRTQSAVSQQIRRLEEELGRPVFAREGRAVFLTCAGETLLPYARRILRAHEEAYAAMTRPELVGQVRLGAPDDYAAYFLPGILARFAASYPLVQVGVHCESSTSLMNNLAQNELDLVVATYAPGEEEGEIIGYEPVVWATSARHTAHEDRPLPLAVFQHGCSYRRLALKALGRVDLPYRIAYLSPSINGIQAAITAGIAVAPVNLHSLPEGARILTEVDGFPPLPMASLTLHRNVGSRSEVVDALADRVVEGFRTAALVPACDGTHLGLDAAEDGDDADEPLPSGCSID